MRYLLALVLTCFVLVTTASAVGQSDEFTVINSSSCYIGVVSVNYVSGGTSVFVPSSGTYTTPINDAVASVTLNGTVVPAQSNAQITFPGGKVILIWADSGNRVIGLGDMPPG